MRKNNKILSIVLVLLLVTTIVVSFVSCSKNKQSNDHRSEYCDSLESTIITSIDPNWSAGLKQNDIAVLSNSGEYVVTSGWVKMICDVVETSSLQTSKIKSISEYLNSEDGKKILSDFSNNSSKLLDFLRKVGLTSEDISNLIYNFVYSVVDNSGTMLKEMEDILSDLYKNKNATLESINSATSYFEKINKARSNFVPTNEEKQNMLKSLLDSKNAITYIVDFAYSVSLGSITEHILSIIESEEGVLSDITNEEIMTVVNSIVRNVASFKEKLTEEEIAKLNNALSLILKKFDTDTNYSLVFSQIVTYSKYAYMIVDAIPDVCDAINVIASSIDINFIDLVKEYVSYATSYVEGSSSSEVYIANTMVLIANIVSKITNQLGESKMLSIINNLYQKSNVGDYQKAFPLLILDVVANAPTIIDSVLKEIGDVVLAHKDIITQDQLIEIMNVTIGLNITLNKFKKAYYNDCVNNDKTFAATLEIEELLKDYATPSVQIIADPARWYTEYVQGIISKLNEFASNNIDVAKADLDKFIEEYFDKDSTIKQNIDSLANSVMLKDDADNTTITSYITKATDAGFYYYAIAAILLKNLL